MKKEVAAALADSYPFDYVGKNGNRFIGLPDNTYHS